MNSYLHQPFSAASEIRILLLESAETLSAALHGSLVHEPLDQAGPYDALSYTWGADVFPHQLHLELQTINITDNLYDCLRHLRPKTGTPRRLWIDALCINQADPDEKSKQIPLMAAIYRGATKVVAWLGLADDASTQAFEGLEAIAGGASEYGFMDQVDHYIPFTNGNRECFTAVNADWEVGDSREMGGAYVSGGSGAGTPRLVSVARLLEAEDADLEELLSAASDVDVCAMFRRPWFSRIWVVQEAIAARELVVQLGTMTLDWKTLAASCILLWLAQRKLGITLVGWAGFELAISLVLARGSRQLLDPVAPVGIEPLADDGEGLNPVQRIAQLNSKAMFAGMKSSLAKNASSETQQVVFASDTYERFNDIVASFRKRDCKDPRDRIYAMLGFKPWNVEWTITPDYNATVEQVYTNYACVLLRHRQLVFLEDGGIWNRRSREDGEDPLPSWVPEHRASRLMHTDRHPWHQSANKATNDPWAYCQLIVEWPKNRLRYHNQVRIEGVVIAKFKSAIGRHKTPQTEGDIEDYLQACMMVALAGKEEGDKYFTGESIQEAVVAASVATIVGVMESSPHDDQKDTIARTGRYVFFTTEEGFFGYAPACVEMSDVVVAFCGRPELFIIRPVEKTLDFRLVSSCYIHGMMDGKFEYSDDYHMIPLV